MIGALAERLPSEFGSGWQKRPDAAPVARQRLAQPVHGLGALIASPVLGMPVVWRDRLILGGESVEGGYLTRGRLTQSSFEPPIRDRETGTAVSLDVFEISESESGQDVLPGARLSKGEKPFDRIPYLPAIRSLLRSDQISAARALLQLALREAPDLDELRKLGEVLAPPRVVGVDRRDKERSADYAWISANRHSYRRQWVALDGGEMIAHAPSLRELLAMLRERRLERTPLLHHID